MPQHRFHHVSTDEVYGSLGLDELPFTVMDGTYRNWLAVQYGRGEQADARHEAGSDHR